MRTVQYDAEKFRELVVYIAERTADDPSFGDIHLNKALYWADFFGYSDLGHPITGAAYQKLPFGPAARALFPVRRELESEGAVHMEEVAAGPYKRKVTVADRGADMRLFSDDEMRLVDQIIDDLSGHSAKVVSDHSHEHSPGWNLVDENEDIPYTTALIAPPESPPEKVLARARERAARLDW